jgi:hypothetical protein
MVTFGVALFILGFFMLIGGITEGEGLAALVGLPAAILGAVLFLLGTRPKDKPKEEK